MLRLAGTQLTFPFAREETSPDANQVADFLRLLADGVERGEVRAFDHLFWGGHRSYSGEFLITSKFVRLRFETRRSHAESGRQLVLFPKVPKTFSPRVSREAPMH